MNLFADGSNAVRERRDVIAAISGGRKATGCSPPPAGDARLVAARGAWAEAHLQAREMRTASPAAVIVRADTLAIRELCQVLMPLGPGAHRAANVDLRPVIYGGARAFGEIAGLTALNARRNGR